MYSKHIWAPTVCLAQCLAVDGAGHKQSWCCLGQDSSTQGKFDKTQGKQLGSVIRKKHQEIKKWGGWRAKRNEF